MRLFVNENAVKAKASEAPPRTPLGELSALSQPLSWCNWV